MCVYTIAQTRADSIKREFQGCTKTLFNLCGIHDAKKICRDSRDVHGHDMFRGISNVSLRTSRLHSTFTSFDMISSEASAISLYEYHDFTQLLPKIFSNITSYLPRIRSSNCFGSPVTPLHNHHDSIPLSLQLRTTFALAFRQ